MSISEKLSSHAASFKIQQATTETGNDVIQAVSVPISINRNGGKLRLYINLTPDVLDNPESLNAALSSLEEMFDLDVWKPSGGNTSTGFKSNRSNYQKGGSW